MILYPNTATFFFGMSVCTYLYILYKATGDSIYNVLYAIFTSLITNSLLCFSWSLRSFKMVI